MIKVNLTSKEAENLLNFLNDYHYDDYCLVFSNDSGIGKTIKVQAIVDGVDVDYEEDITSNW